MKHWALGALAVIFSSCCLLDIHQMFIYVIVVVFENVLYPNINVAVE